MPNEYLKYKVSLSMVFSVLFGTFMLLHLPVDFHDISRKRENNSQKKERKILRIVQVQDRKRILYLFVDKTKRVRFDPQISRKSLMWDMTKRHFHMGNLLL